MSKAIEIFSGQGWGAEFSLVWDMGTTIKQRRLEKALRMVS